MARDAAERILSELAAAGSGRTLEDVARELDFEPEALGEIAELLAEGVSTFVESPADLPAGFDAFREAWRARDPVLLPSGRPVDPAALEEATWTDDSFSTSGLAGRTLGRWTVGDVLGRGGMGHVHLATSGKEVAAIKILPPISRGRGNSRGGSPGKRASRPR